ncbi:hypothetical protein chiPu_0030461, partial [Chiloscyllium punctatum]|nr:hypothetical protein [Chiloscyllium punctatum]
MPSPYPVHRSATSAPGKIGRPPLPRSPTGFCLQASSATFPELAGAREVSMRKGNDYILKLRPWSLSTFVVALLVVVLATATQEMFASFGMQLYFAGFVPAILVAGLMGGAPAGAFATIITVPIVWWAFMPPYFEFAWPTAD